MTAKSFWQAVCGTAVCSLLAGQAFAAPVRDLKFMKSAAQGGLYEVQMGQIAERNAGSRGVRQFGMQMVRDHSQANHDLMRIAMQEGVLLPHRLDPKDQASKMRLSALHGNAFDRAYIRNMIADHIKDLIAFRQEAQAGKNRPVRTFADKYQTVIQGHLMMAQDLHHKGL